MIQNHPCRYLLKKNENVSKKKKKKTWQEYSQKFY